MTFTENAALTHSDSRGYKAVEIITPLDSGATLTITSSRGRVLAVFAHTATADPTQTGSMVFFSNSENTITLAGQTTFPAGEFVVDIRHA